MFVSNEELNVELCVASGQVFRWKKSDYGWSGIDGCNFIEAIRTKNGWQIESFPDKNAFVRFFQLDRTNKEICEQILKLGPELKPYVERHPGLRVLKPEYVHETLFSFMCTPNNHLSRITKMVDYLGSKGKDSINGLKIFPALEQIAELNEFELRQNGFGYRASSIVQVANTICSKEPSWLNGLRKLDYHAAHRELCGLTGIGPKVADCICLFGTYHEVAVPIDTHLWQAACHVYFPEWKGTALTTKKYEMTGSHFRNRFGNLAGWAHQYLFYDRVLNYRKGKPPVYSAS